MKVELLYRPLQWQLDGLQETASGYGAKLTSRMMAKLPDGNLRRVYVTQWANAGTAWFTWKGERQTLPDTAASGETVETCQ